MTTLLILALAIQPAQPAARPRRPAAQAPPAANADPADDSSHAAGPPAYPDRASRDAAARRDARDRVVDSLGDGAKAFTRKYGDSGIYSLLKCGPGAGKRLLAMEESGGLDRLEYPLAALDAVRMHGDAAAEFLADNAGRLEDPVALRAWLRNPMEFAYDLRDLGRAAEELRAAARSGPPEAAAGRFNAGYAVAVVALLAAGWAIYNRNRPRVAP